MFAIFVLMLAAFVLMLAAFFMFATFMLAFTFSFLIALMFWHVGFHFLHFLCHVDEICSLFFIEVFPVSKSFDHSIHASHHLRTWSLVVVAFMMLVALLFLVFAAFFVFVVFLFVAA